MCITDVLLNKQFHPHKCGDQFIAIMLLAITTSCDGGGLLTTQGTHICLILSLILDGGSVAFISPNMRWSISPTGKGQVHEAHHLNHPPTHQSLATTAIWAGQKRGVEIRSDKKRCPARCYLLVDTSHYKCQQLSKGVKKNQQIQTPMQTQTQTETRTQTQL